MYVVGMKLPFEGIEIQSYLCPLIKSNDDCKALWNSITKGRYSYKRLLNVGACQKKRISFENH